MAATTLACPRCSTPNATGAAYCSVCGLDLRDPTERTTQHPASEHDPLLERLRSATLGDYDVAIELGRGGMAAVYLAHDLALDRKVAIKVMLPELTKGPDMIERFRREARTAANLSHPHIIPIYHVREVDGMVFFVMKFVEGRSLDAIIREKGALPVRMVETILSQSASALAYAHRKGVIHRDIKPANIMLDEDGWAVVTDFGIAKITDASVLTTTGATMGTPYYMSPEQCSSKPVTGQSDQYSLGIAAYELLTGRPPFDGPSLMEVMSGHFFTPPKPIHLKRPDCPTPLEQIVLKMIAKEPKERFATLDEVVSSLAMPAMGHDDPVRSQMIELAKSGTSLQSRLSVPVSPVPMVRSRAAPSAKAGGFAVGPAPAVSPPPARRTAPVVLGLATLVITVSAAVFAWQGSWVGGRDDISGVGGEQGTGTAPPTDQPATGDGMVPPAGTTVAALDSAARLDSIRRDSLQRDSLERDRVRRDIAKRDSIRRDSIRRARDRRQAEAPAPTLPPPNTAVVPLAPVDDSQTRLVLGTSTRGAMLYIDGEPRDTISRPRLRRIPAATMRLAIVLEGCTPWDSTVTVAPNDTVRIGFREPKCE